MKTKMLMFMAFLMITFTAVYANMPDKDKKALRAEKNLEIRKQVESLITSKHFVFVATRALPMLGSSISLTQNSNYLRLDPENIESYMPFFGSTYSADYNVDRGVKFEGKPEVFEIKKLKKDRGYDIRAKVALPGDTYEISMQVSLEGSSNMTISSYRRSSISYIGVLALPEPPAPKKTGDGN